MKVSHRNRAKFLAAMTFSVLAIGLIPGEAKAGLEASNALSSNALSSNALTSNALGINALSSNALGVNGLSSNGLPDNTPSSNGTETTSSLPSAPERTSHRLSFGGATGAHFIEIEPAR